MPVALIHSRTGGEHAASTDTGRKLRDRLVHRAAAADCVRPLRRCEPRGHPGRHASSAVRGRCHAGSHRRHLGRRPQRRRGGRAPHAPGRGGVPRGHVEGHPAAARLPPQPRRSGDLGAADQPPLLPDGAHPPHPPNHPGRDFTQLARPLTIVTADVLTSHVHWIDSGDLVQALKAATAIPGLFPPVRIEGRTLWDAGLVANVPLQTPSPVDLGALWCWTPVTAATSTCPHEGSPTGCSWPR